jgi:hypothetical protein
MFKIAQGASLRIRESSQTTRMETGWLGQVPEVTSGMEARAAIISTGLGVDDLDEAFQSRGWRALETTRKNVESDSGTKRSLP